ncbi:MAG: response regulator [Methylococcales bacterium]|nr:response regulator [Methylococcales bacterium]MBT7410669.1 response regulator [Methylococcales bacterium]
MQAKKQKILIVDDVLTNITVLAEILHDDYELLMATNGFEAIERTKNNPPDLILLDIMMPEMDGYEVCKCLKEDQQTLNIPIIFITAKDHVKDEEKGLKLGCIDYISKPFNQLVVKERIKNHLLLKWQSDHLVAAKNELEQKVNERTAELNDAKEMAESANDVKSIFLRTISHEIRTPLNAIFGMNQLMLLTNLTDDQKECMTTMYKSCELLIAIINDVLNFSSIESGQIQVEFTDFYLREMIDDVMSEIECLTRERSIELSVDIDDIIPNQLNGDSLKLRKVMMNLLDNANKFTENGQIQVLIRMLGEKNGQLHLSFSVKDSGIGLPKNLQQDIFDMFVQAGGMGLGLSLSQKLVSLMGGQIEFESEEGIGSIFHFSLMFNRCLSNDKLLVEKKVSSADIDLKKKTVINKNKKRILVVDDNQVNQMVIQGMMDSLGYDTVVASNGSEALKIFEQFDLILMDLDMPVMDGFEATREIRFKEKNTKIPIIALTAHAFDEVRVKSLAMGMDDFLTKPVKIDELSKILSRYQ